MAKKNRTLGQSEKGTREGVKIVEVENDYDDWCFVCKDGGSLRCCDHPNCGKYYHFDCVGQKKSFLKSSKDWRCARHSCTSCKGIPMVTCYCCPDAVCYKCLSAEFFRIDDENGFCRKCMELVLFVERVTKHKPKNVSLTAYKNFAEFYKVIKKKNVFTLDHLLVAKEKGKSREKRKLPSLDEVHVNERPGGFQKIKLDSSKSSQNEEVVNDIIMVSSIDHANVRLIYLTRSVIEKLLMQPESFEDKVKRTFIGIELPRKGASNKIVRQLAQVIGITKTSCHDGQMTIKLKVKNMPNDVSIDMVSDLDFSETLCNNLIQQVEDGLIEMPALEELQRMAKVLSTEIVDDDIARQTRLLQRKIDMANEKGWRQQLFPLANHKKLLQTPSERLRLISTYPNRAIVKILYTNTGSQKSMNEKQGIKDCPESIPNTDMLCKNGIIASGPRPKSKNMVDDEEQEEGSPKSITYNLELKTDKSSVSKESQGIFGLVQEGERKPVNKPLIGVPVPLMTMEEEVIPEQNRDGERTMIGKSLMASVIVDDDVQGTNEELAKHCDAQRFAVESECGIRQQFGNVLEEIKRCDVMPEELKNNAKEITVVKEKLNTTTEEKMDVELVSERGKTLELGSLEEKIYNLEQQMEQLQEKKAQSAQGAILVSYIEKAEMFADTLCKLLEPVTRLACTKTLEEIKAKHLPDLDLSQFPIYDPRAAEMVHPLMQGTVQSFIDAGLAQKGTVIDKKSS